MIDIGTGGAKPKTYSRKKKITKPLNLADFTIPGYRRKNKKTKKKQGESTDTPTQSVEPTFAGDAVDDIVPLRKAKTCAARKYETRLLWFLSYLGPKCKSK